MLAVTFLFLLVFCQTFKVSVINGAELRLKAVDQWTRELPIKAKRGDILDANGVIFSDKIKCDEPSYFAFDGYETDFFRVEIFDATEGLRIAIGNPIWKAK